MSHLYVINSRGGKESFSLRKVYRSARRVGASKDLAERIARVIQKKAYPGVRTSEIFREIKKILSQRALGPAIKFSLKEAMRKLGPTGFPFEKYIGEIFSKQEFEVKLNQRLSGYCLNYEIDFLAQKENLLYIGECKYRNLPEGRVHSKAALANYARFLDLKKGNFFNKKEFRNLELKTILVTNTKFSKDAVKFSRCVGIELLGWKYPKLRGLEYFIDSQRLYPITILPSLKKDLAAIFASKKIMLVQDILRLDPMKFAKGTKISAKRLKLLIEEAKILLR